VGTLRKLSRHGLRLLAATGFTFAAIGAAPVHAQAQPLYFDRYLTCDVGRFNVRAKVIFQFVDSPNIGFQWKRIDYVTTPGFKANYVSFSYGKGVKVRFGKPHSGKHHVPHRVSVKPSGKYSALPAHLTMKVLTQQGDCTAKFL
jgi:hypothetical protein